MHIKSAPIGAVKAGPEDGLAEGEFIVYPSTFTRTADAYGDVVAKGAFAEDIKVWKDSGNTLPGLYGHRMDDPDFFVASAVEMGEDDHGWWVKGAFDLESPKGKQVYRLVKGRRLSQLSFAYDVLESGKSEGDDGEAVNELRKLKVYEFSFVPVGANQDTSVVAVKAIVDQIENPDVLREMRDALTSEIESRGAVSDKSTRSGGEDQEKASGEPPAAPDGASDEPIEAKSSVSDVVEPKVTPSVERLAAHIRIHALKGAERGVSS